VRTLLLSSRLKKGKGIFSKANFNATLEEFDSALSLLNRNEYSGNWEMLAIQHFFPKKLDSIRDGKGLKHIIKKAKLNWKREE